MVLFSKHGRKLKSIKETGFRRELDLQHIVEDNMDLLLDLVYVTSELKVGNFRIDSLGFNQNSNSFVIIEYKRDRNKSIIDQGMAYVSLLTENKAEFILAHNEEFDPIRKRDINWKQSRVIFIARDFTAHQKQASGFRDLPISLYEIKKFRNSMIMFNSVTAQNESVPNRKKPKKVIKNNEYTEKEHLIQASTKTRELYTKTKKILKSLDDGIQIIPQRHTIMFRNKRGFAWIIMHKNTLDLTLKIKLPLLDDPKKIVQDVTNIGHWGGGGVRIKISTVSELPYIRRLIEQAYSKIR